MVISGIMAVKSIWLIEVLGARVRITQDVRINMVIRVAFSSEGY